MNATKLAEHRDAILAICLRRNLTVSTNKGIIRISGKGVSLTATDWAYIHLAELLPAHEMVAVPVDIPAPR